MSDNDIQVKQDGPILRITLNRPEQGNSCTDPMALKLIDTLLKAADTSRLVVLTGAGKDFCVGRAGMGEAVDDAGVFDRWRLHRGGRLIHAEAMRLDGAVAAKLAQPAVARFVLIGAMLVALMAYRPQGLFGRQRVEIV